MTDEQFRDELRRMGFVPTNQTTSIARRWDHVSGAVRWITEPQYLGGREKEIQIQSVKRSIRVH